MNLITVNPSDILPHPQNYNPHTDAEVGELVKSLDRFDQYKNIVVWRDPASDTLYSLAGEGLCKAAVAAGMTELEVNDRSDLSHEDALALMLTDNYSASKEYDEALVFDLMQQVKGPVPGIDAELMAMLEAEHGAGQDGSGDGAGDGPGLDRAEELQGKWGVKVGDVWGCGEHRVICGDSTSLDLTDLLGEIILTLTDPPYGISIVKGLRAADGGSKPVTIGSVRPRRPYPFGGAKNVRGTVGGESMVDATLYRPVQGDDEPFDPDWLLSFGENQIIFGGNYFASKLPDSRCWIVWDKNNTGNFADAELAWTSFDRVVKLYQYTWNGLLREGSRKLEGKRRVHPTQKPVGLFVRILQDFSQDGDVIADPYLGSGTTIMACEVAGRIGVGAEIDPAYCAVTLQRFQDAFDQAPVLLSPGPVTERALES